MLFHEIFFYHINSEITVTHIMVFVGVEKVEAIREEVHYRMSLTQRAYVGLKGKKGYGPDHPPRLAVTYTGKAERLRGKTIYIQRDGRVFDAPMDGKQLDR